MEPSWLYLQRVCFTFIHLRKRAGNTSEFPWKFSMQIRVTQNGPNNLFLRFSLINLRFLPKFHHFDSRTTCFQNASSQQVSDFLVATVHRRICIYFHLGLPAYSCKTNGADSGTLPRRYRSVPSTGASESHRRAAQSTQPVHWSVDSLEHSRAVFAIRLGARVSTRNSREHGPN